MDTFKFVQWNVGGQDPDHVYRHAKNQRNNGVTNFAFEEVNERLITTVTSLGLNFHVTGWCMNAWDPLVWVSVNGGNARLAERPWVSGDGKRVLYMDCDLVILSDLRGRTITQGAYKLPPSIQNGGRRVDLAVEGLAGLGKLVEDSRTDDFVVGADINYDVNKGNKVLALDQALRDLPLRTIQAPSATCGPRRIDVIQSVRVRNGGQLAAMGEPWVAAKRGPAIHRLVGQEFGWKE